MKLNFSLKNKEINLDADVKGIVEKSLEYKSKRPEKPAKKTRYQIRQEEKRKNETQKHKQLMQYFYLLLGIVGICIIIAIFASIFDI